MAAVNSEGEACDRLIESESSGVGRLELFANRLPLWRALRDASAILPENGKSVVQICVLGEACVRSQSLALTCWAEGLRMTIEVPAEVSADGRFAVPADLLRSILHGAGEEDVKIVGEPGGSVRISCGKGHFVLEEWDLEELPERSDEEEMDSALAVPLDVPWFLGGLEILHQAMYWIRDDALWVRGFSITIRDGESDFVAMNRSQLVVLHRPVDGLGNLAVMLPERAVAALVNLPMANRDIENATMRVGSSAVLLSMGPVELYFKLMEEAQSPDWKRRMPAGSAHEPIGFDREELLGVIRRMSLAASSARTRAGMRIDVGPAEFRPVSLGPLQCMLSEGSITFECRVRDEIQSIETMPVSYAGQPLKSILSVWQLQRVLDTMCTEQVSLQFAGEMGPCVISSEEAPDFQCVLSPIWTGGRGEEQSTLALGD